MPVLPILSPAPNAGPHQKEASYDSPLESCLTFGRDKPANRSLLLLISAFVFLAFSSLFVLCRSKRPFHPKKGRFENRLFSAARPSDSNEETSASKLYEAVLRYLEGLHRRGSSGAKEVAPKPQRRDPNQVPHPFEPLRILQREEAPRNDTQARNEWDLAVHPLERALKIASRSVSAARQVELKTHSRQLVPRLRRSLPKHLRKWGNRKCRAMRMNLVRARQNSLWGVLRPKRGEYSRMECRREPAPTRISPPMRCESPGLIFWENMT